MNEGLGFILGFVVGATVVLLIGWFEQYFKNQKEKTEKPDGLIFKKWSGDIK